MIVQYVSLIVGDRGPWQVLWRGGFLLTATESPCLHASFLHVSALWPSLPPPGSCDRWLPQCFPSTWPRFPTASSAAALPETLRSAPSSGSSWPLSEAIGGKVEEAQVLD